MPTNPDHWFSRAKRFFREGPYQLTRRPVPTPGSENLVNLTWAIPETSPINYAIPNWRQFEFQNPVGVPVHLVGPVGPGGYQVSNPYEATPLTQTEPALSGAQVALYG